MPNNKTSNNPFIKLDHRFREIAKSLNTHSKAWVLQKQLLIFIGITLASTLIFSGNYTGNFFYLIGLFGILIIFFLGLMLMQLEISSCEQEAHLLEWSNLRAFLSICGDVCYGRFFM